MHASFPLIIHNRPAPPIGSQSVSMANLVPSCCLLQTSYIPDELYKRVYDICKRLLILPQPYCTVGLGYAKHMKTEMSTPGMWHCDPDGTLMCNA